MVSKIVYEFLAFAHSHIVSPDAYIHQNLPN